MFVCKCCYLCEELETRAFRGGYARLQEKLMSPNGPSQVHGAKNIVANFLLVFLMKREKKVMKKKRDYNKREQQQYIP